MRFGISTVSTEGHIEGTPRISWGRVLRVMAGILIAGAMTGCEVNDYFNPGEPQIRPKGSAPLAVPIVDTLDRNVDVPEVGYTQAEEVQAKDLIPDISDYRIGKNDVVSVSIFDLMGEGTGETTKVVRVSETGMISLPFVSPIKAEQLTEQELEKAIAAAYQEAKLVKNARVSCQVTEARARTFSIQGNVGSPGEFQLTRPDFRMLDAMMTAHAPIAFLGVDYAYVVRKLSAEAPSAPAAPMETPPASTQPTPPGDLLNPQSDANPSGRTGGIGRTLQMDQPASDKNLLAPGSDEGASGMIEGKPAPSPDNNNTNNTTPAPTQTLPPPTGVSPEPSNNLEFQFHDLKEPTDVRVIRVPIIQLLQYGQLKYNLVIRPGDMILVPNPQTGFYYVGGHVIRAGVYSLAGAKVTIKNAWVAAGGPDDFAYPRRSELIRRVGPNKEIAFRIDIGKIWGFEQPDIYLQPDDQIMVGTNILAPFVASVRNSFRLTYGFGFLYDRNFSSTTNAF